MKTCREIQLQTSDLLEGELTMAERIGITMHLLLCGDCRRSVQHLRLLVNSLALYPQQETLPSAALIGRIVGNIPEKGPRRSCAEDHDDEAPGDSVTHKN